MKVFMLDIHCLKTEINTNLGEKDRLSWVFTPCFGQIEGAICK